MSAMDSQDLTVSTPSPDALKATNHFIHQLLSSGNRAGDIVTAVQAHPSDLLLQCYTAAFYLYAQDNQLTAKAKVHLSEAEKLLSRGNEREVMLFQAIQAWSELNYEKSTTLFITITEIWPQDCVAGKLAEWLFYCTGQAYHAKRFLNMCDNMSSANRDNSHFLAIHAFALELNKRYEEAYSLATRAIEIEPITPWAHHALSHVYLMTGRIQEGITALEIFKPLWRNTLPSLSVHNTWHLGLFYIANRDKEKAIQLYQDDLWGTLPDMVGEQIDAISFLWRLDMAGISHDKAWADIILHLQDHARDHYMPFNNAHYIYALIRSSNYQEAGRAIHELEKYALDLSGDQFRMWHTITKPLLYGVAAFARGDYKDACGLLSPIMDEVFCVGGSDAQDELFVQTYYLSLLYSGHVQEASRYFDEHLSHYRDTALYEYWFGAIREIS